MSFTWGAGQTLNACRKFTLDYLTCSASATSRACGTISAPPMTAPTRVMSPGFRSRVFDIVRRIPKGKVSTYGRIAALLGHPGVARHVGNALAACGNEELPVPWHRVVNASGKVSTAGSEQEARLLAEGVRFSSAGAIPLAQFIWTPSPQDVNAKSVSPQKVKSTAKPASSRKSKSKPKTLSSHSSKSKAKRSKHAAVH